eukprot:gene31524-biopygen23951
MSSSDHLANILHEVPAMLIPCYIGKPTPEMRQGQVAGMYGSILPAVWSFMLAARSRGLGTAWTTLHLGYEQEAAELLGIPENVCQVAMTPVAFYTGDDFKPGSVARIDAAAVERLESRIQQEVDAERSLAAQYAIAVDGQVVAGATFGAVDHDEVRRDAGFQHGLDHGKPLPRVTDAQLEAHRLAAGEFTQAHDEVH